MSSRVGIEVERLGLRTREDLDTTRHLVLWRISIRKRVHGQWDISTMRCIIMEHDGRP